MIRIIKDSIEYYGEYIWRKSIKDKTVDEDGKKYPFPKEGLVFGDKSKIVKILSLAEDIIKKIGPYEKYEKSISCKICGKKNIDRYILYSGNRARSDGVIHYIEKHNVEPSVSFKDYIYNNLMKNIEKDLSRARARSSKNNKINNKISNKILEDPELKKVTLEKVKINNEDYAKLERNKILILDALMAAGGKFKKYVDPYDKNIKRYSEHAGFLDFDNGSLQKIVVSAQTDRVDEGDNEIFLPKDMDEMLEYEYIFHTHPPTPNAGGRAEYGILFEYPSIGDIFHFIDHYNDGNVLGSMVIAAEGLYNIRRVNLSDLDPEELDIKNKKPKGKMEDIDIDEDRLYDDYRKIFRKLQREAIDKYGIKFEQEYFYDTIAQDTSYMKRFNKVLNRYQIHIDFYPRKKDGKHWYIDTIFLKFEQK